MFCERQAYSTLSIAIRDAGQNRGPGGADEKLTPEGGNITYAKEHDELVEPIPEKRTRKKQDESLAFRKMLVHQA